MLSLQLKSRNETNRAIYEAQEGLFIMFRYGTAVPRNGSYHAYLAERLVMTGLMCQDDRNYVKATDYLATAAQELDRFLCEKQPPKSQGGDYRSAYDLSAFCYAMCGCFAAYSGDYGMAVK